MSYFGPFTFIPFRPPMHFSRLLGRQLSPFLKSNYSRKKPLQGISMTKSEEYSTYATNLFFKDSESVLAKRFQDRNSMI